MKEMKKTGSNRAITLIALIITIIVMLILVGVTIQVTINSGIIGTTQNAVDRTETAYATEQNTVDKYLEYMNQYIGAEHNWQYTDETLAELKCECSSCTATDSAGKTYTIGQVVDYTDNGKATSEISGIKSGVTQGIIDGKLSASDYGTDGIQTISKDEETTWVVFGREDTNGDGEYETLLLTTETPLLQLVTLYGADAYLYGPEEIDRMCKELYGTNARAMTIEDVNRTLGYEPTGGMYIVLDSTGIVFNTLDNFTTQLNGTIKGTTETNETYLASGIWDVIKSNTVYAPEQNNNTDSTYKLTTPDRTLATSSAIEEYVIDGYNYGKDSAVTGGMFPSVDSEVSSTVKTLVFGNENDYLYWLASRGVMAYSGGAYFAPGAVLAGVAFSSGDDYDSNCRADVSSFGMRAVVSLTSDIP